MDRRNFFKTILTTPLLTPFILRAKKTHNDLEIFLIGDTPEQFFPALLDELEMEGMKHHQNYSFLTSHPREKDLIKVFSQKGWDYVQNHYQASWTLSYRPLHKNAASSFTLVQNDRIWDLRSRRLLSLWEELSSSHALSTDLTIASFKTRKTSILPGKMISLYQNGQRIDRISMEKTTSKSFRTKKGGISINIDHGKAWISESSCKNKICLSTPPVYLAGERIVCAPNHFLIEVEGPRPFDTVIG